jgi:hypothetical protein
METLRSIWATCPVAMAKQHPEHLTSPAFSLPARSFGETAMNSKHVQILRVLIVLIGCGCAARASSLPSVVAKETFLRVSRLASQSLTVTGLPRSRSSLRDDRPSGVRLTLRGTCRGGPPWPPLAPQISHRENKSMLPDRNFRRAPLAQPAGGFGHRYRCPLDQSFPEPLSFVDDLCPTGERDDVVVPPIDVQISSRGSDLHITPRQPVQNRGYSRRR